LKLGTSRARCRGVPIGTLLLILAALACGSEPAPARPGEAREAPGSAAEVSQARPGSRAAQPLGEADSLAPELSPDAAPGPAPAPSGADAEAREGGERALAPFDPAAGASEARAEAPGRAAEGLPSDSRQHREYPLEEPTVAIEIHEEQWRLLESHYPADREIAVATLPPYGEGLDLLIETLADDPSPEVRAAAAGKLIGTGTHAATSALLQALQDSDPIVVVSAIEVLQMMGDPSVLPEIEPLLMHQSNDVRDSARDAVEILQPLE
jgi:hypothetical protein